MQKLVSLSLRPHLIQYVNYCELIEKSKGILERLMIDCDELPWLNMQQILNKLNPELITELKLYYCEYYPNAILKRIEFFHKLQTFYFTKGSAVERPVFDNFFQNNWS